MIARVLREHKEAFAFAAAASTYIGMRCSEGTDAQPRLIRAFSGELPPDDHTTLCPPSSQLTAANKVLMVNEARSALKATRAPTISPIASAIRYRPDDLGPETQMHLLFISP